MHSNHNHGYLLLFRGTTWHRDLSAAEIQNVMGQWAGWFRKLSENGQLAGGNPLENEGTVITGNNTMIADGPFTESKEAVGGYFLLQVDSMEEAVAIARECPALPHGITVEVRPVAPQCPAGRMAAEVAALASA